MPSTNSRAFGVIPIGGQDRVALGDEGVIDVVQEEVDLGDAPGREVHLLPMERQGPGILVPARYCTASSNMPPEPQVGS